MNEYNAKGQRHGVWESYYGDGQLDWSCNFVNGKLHGLYESYYINGNLCSKGLCQNNQGIGFWLHGYSYGKIRKEFHL